jgi:uncharacterized phiE125 gp8 family phage protein
MATTIRPPALPVPLEQLKAYLRIRGSEEDALLAGLLRTATELCEAFTRLALIEREIEEVLPARPGWMRLGDCPVRAILTVTSLSAAGETNVLAPEDHAVDIDARGEGWVRVTRGVMGRLTVRYLAGLAQDWNGVSEPLRQGIVRLAAHLYTHRDGLSGGGPPAAVTALWLPFRRLRLS